ncbi:unnamed protein product [Bursaphelenchus xylophilus]|uniref:(pine wood nematode) hypothetical protein n=1 Tax=Bursaphelenchus xylophilus TaxID=6326 RepID=A0A1I7RPT1_BURXY|nr:unnamed protein product [Bursaphelenchus xylophilus]CAG9096564.1 unnamed protein product [Bursaphelenchus xylophilus]
MTDRPPTFNELLIREVQNHPELYDQQHRVCTDNEERNMMWEVIARRIDDNVTGEFAKKRWLQMRDRYRKELKMALRNMTQPKWPYFEKLSWLDPYLKDSKSAGLHPPFINNKLESTENNTLLESIHKISESKPHFWSHFPTNENSEVPEFPYPNAVSTDTLLQNIMAASSSAFEQLQRHREEGEFSPDSAIASTSEDGDHQGPLNVQPSSSTTASEAGSSASSQIRNQSASPEHEQPVKSDESSSNSESGQSVEQLTLDTSLLAMPGLTNPDGSLSFMGSVLRNLSASVNSQSQPVRTNSRNRNPPYLVRRGGGIKIKQERPSGDARGFKPLVKTMSVGGNHASNLLNLNGTPEKEGDDRLPEWTTDEDVLFARLVAVRLKKFGAKDKRIIRSRISEFMDEKEEQIELNKVRSG